MKRVFDYIATCENIDGRALEYISKIHCVVRRLIFTPSLCLTDFQHHYHNNCNEDHGSRNQRGHDCVIWIALGRFNLRFISIPRIYSINESRHAKESQHNSQYIKPKKFQVLIDHEESNVIPELIAALLHVAIIIVEILHKLSQLCSQFSDSTQTRPYLKLKN